MSARCSASLLALDTLTFAMYCSDTCKFCNLVVVAGALCENVRKMSICVCVCVHGYMVSILALHKVY